MNATQATGEKNTLSTSQHSPAQQSAALQSSSPLVDPVCRTNQPASEKLPQSPQTSPHRLSPLTFSFLHCFLCRTWWLFFCTEPPWPADVAVALPKHWRWGRAAPHLRGREMRPPWKATEAGTDTIMNRCTETCDGGSSRDEGSSQWRN